MTSVANKIPIDVVKYIFNYTPNYVLRGNEVIQINKIAGERYAPLRRMFLVTNWNVNVVKGFLGFKIVSLFTEERRMFYLLQCLGDELTTHIVGEGVSDIVYVRE
jgi:hypothetical protein